MKGCVQIYTGNGKGKTTAALGLVVRACGAGLRVYFGQFLKLGVTSELKTLRRRFPDVTVEQFGRRGFIRGAPTTKDIAAAGKGLRRLRAALRSGAFDVVIADEAVVAASLGLFATADLVALTEMKPPEVELVITGRGAPAQLIKCADLVTEMRPVKHYFSQGVAARRGIEK
jgi:cob(I)alamin adenosyltransferase